MKRCLQRTRAETMAESSTHRIARHLLDARRPGSAAVPPDAAEAPADADAAYAVQDLVAREVGPVGAWKVGAASPTTEPLRAPIFASTIYSSPLRLPSSMFRVIGI